MSKSIHDMGWDELVIGAACYSFEDTLDNKQLAEVHPTDRNYAETSSKNKYVGDWRVFKPVWQTDICIDCQFCWIYCPDTSILSRDKKMIGIDMDHCKGCGICVEVCPTNPKSLLMFDEHMPEEEALAQWPEKDSKAKEVSEDE